MSSSRYGGTVETASRPISTQGSLQLNVARRIASAASDQENENRRIFVRDGGQGGQEVQQGDRREQRGAQLVQAEDLPAEEGGLHAPGPDQLGRDAQVEGQPRQERAGEGRAP